MKTTDEINARFTVAILGLGEAGSSFARELVKAGLTVHGWDPIEKLEDGSIYMAESARDAVEKADVILSLNSASVALEVAEEVAGRLGAGQLFADLNTGAPNLKAELAETIECTGALFADVALMSPVPGNGLRTPTLVSGNGAQAFTNAFAPLGMPVELLSREPGAAAARKLVRSVFMKGMAVAILEGMEAASKLNLEGWLRDEITSVFLNADERLLDRLIRGSYKHAERRVGEMEAACKLLSDLKIPPRVSRASAEWLREIGERSARHEEDA